MRRAVVNTLFICCLLLTVNSVLGQYKTQNRLTFNNYTTLNHNLSTNYFYRVFQDKQGFLWFASDNGLYLYDGVSFKIILGTEGMDIVSWYVEEKKILWLFDYNGNISSFNILQRQLEKYGNLSKNKDEWKKVRPFVLGYKFNGALYFTKLYDVETIVLNKQTKKSSQSTVFAEFRNKIFEQFQIKKDSTEDQLHMYPNANFILPEGDKSLIKDGLIYEMDKSNKPATLIFNGKDFNNIKDITYYVRKENHLYLSIWNHGLIKLTNYFSSNEPTQIDTILKHDRVTNFLFDNYNQLWITTTTDGIFKQNAALYNLKKINYPQLNVINDEISSLLAINGHILFFVKNSNTLIVYDTLSKQVFFQNIFDLKHSDFNTIGQIKGKYYAIFQSGLFNLSFHNHKILFSRQVFFPHKGFIAKDASFYHDELYINNRLNILKVEPQNQRISIINFDNKNLSSLVQLGKDSFLYGTTSGLLLNDKKILF